MTITSLRELAEHHEEMARSRCELAHTMVGQAAEDVRAAGAKHLKWSEELRQLAQAFETLRELST